MNRNAAAEMIKMLYRKSNPLGLRIVRESTEDFMERPGFLTRFLYTASETLKSQWIQLSAAGVFLLLSAGTIYYYNMLVTSEQDVMASVGKVNALRQRRHDISINLSKAVYDYSLHEKKVLTAIVSLRGLTAEASKNKLVASAGKKSLNPDNSLGNLAALLAVAEQYPTLKLSDTFQSLMTALIDIEKELSAERINYNDKVNTYTTNLAQFPANFCALLFGFKARDYFTTTKQAKTFVPIGY